MPELPEVEVVRRQLKDKLVGRTIKNIVSYHDKIFNEDLTLVKETLINQEILDIERYGKYLVFIFKENVLISHLRMEGKYFFREVGTKKDKHEHVFFELDNNISLRYHDTRKFGRMDLRKKNNYLDVLPLNKLGSEPKYMQNSELYNLITNRNISIKTALLNQEIIAGLGNIYVDETLFLSKIHPMRKTNEISMEEADLITKSATKVLDKALALGGTTIRSYTSAEGVTGLFQNELLVHTKEGEPCPNCNNIITKLKVGGRGTYVCDQCQK
ncbi:MAG TPA: bifunctional DNA-formamidopyrimidine glycosylase/DNA-(apurinic or apyrimidinic site) lyase [Acholeplasmataceae bacterium]|nr:bifunctional DNA-formamidopyrimidine glycosylase/DNA-(apurinic or apyrimidinic site) lyase [Acholeplasmataceae bacterium]